MLKPMKLKYQDKEIELLYSFRANIYFEQLQGKNVDFQNFSSNDMIMLFYCIFISTLQKNKMPIVSFTDFLDIIDDNEGDKCLIDFANWYVNILKNEYVIVSDINGDNKKPEIEDPAKKKN